MLMELQHRYLLEEIPTMAAQTQKTQDQELPKGAPTNADVSAEGVEIAKEYDKQTEQRLEEQKSSNEELGEGVVRLGGAGEQGSVVVTGASGPLESVGDLGVGTQTTYPGLLARYGTSDAATGLRLSKWLPTTGIVPQSANSWTAQSAAAFTPSNATQVVGQTFTSEELPDAAAVTASKLPAHAIPAALVVDPSDARALLEDSLNSSQDGGDLGTAPKRNRTGPAGPV